MHRLAVHHSLGTSVSLPNIITLGRVILVPIIFWLLVTGNSQAAFYLVVIAGLSDAVDGFLAKRFGLETGLGAYLDPLADKLLIVSLYIALGVSKALPLWLVIAVVSRDILIVAAVLISGVFGQPLQMKPLTISKANTVAQIVLAATVLAAEGFALQIDGIRTALVWITGTLTVLSLAIYLKTWLRHMAGYEPGASDGTKV
jgi:cardiolipin synthase (CMP-forming)